MGKFENMIKSLLNLNHGVIWIKVAYGLFGLGMILVFPYITLQMASLGLTNVDVSLLYGIIPLISMPFVPISGFIGDTIGYKFVLSAEIIITGSAFTSFHFIPRFRFIHK